MYGKTIWQWFKPLLLIFPVIAVTATTLFDLTASGQQAAAAGSGFGANQLRLPHDEAAAGGQLPDAILDVAAETVPLAPKPAAVRSTVALGTHVRNHMIATAMTWAELIGDRGARANGSHVLGDSFQEEQHIQAVIVHHSAPANPNNPATVSADAPAATSHANGSGTSNSGPGNGADDGDDDDDDGDDDDDDD